MGEGRVLICRIGACLCALALAEVVETMRCLPVEPMAGAPDFVMGLSIVRGEPVPVVDLAVLLGLTGEPPTRLVTVRAGGRLLALAVSAVGSVRRIDPEVLASLPPLLREARPGAATSIGVLDEHALLAVEAIHVVPDDVWKQIARSDEASAGSER